jgi:hypothetical protein
MKIIAFGTEPVGIIAIGQNATGVLAVGQLATGVVAVGQLARGVLVAGQLAIGVVAVGQGVVALTYGGGMIGVAGLKTHLALVVWGVAGDGHLREGGRWHLTAEWRRTSTRATAIRVLALAVLAATIALVSLSWLPGFADEDDAPDEPPPATLAPGSR